MTENERKKAEVITTILKNDTYLPDSGMYKLAASALAKMSLMQLESLNTILVFKQNEKS